MNAKIFLFGASVLLLPSIRCEDALRNCEGEADGYTMPVPGVCSDFYLCLNEQPVKLTCGVMAFNTKTHSCDAPGAVDCERQGEEPTANMCERRGNGDLIASVENCSDFFVCIGKVALPRSCGWMHFDAETGKCVDWRFSRCDRSKLTPKSRPVVKYFDEKSGPILITI